MHTPRRNGEPLKAGALDLNFSFLRPFRTNWLIVGIVRLKDSCSTRHQFSRAKGTRKVAKVNHRATSFLSHFFG
jgi:hypothetical protein